jgi:hypothetical protein
LSLILFSDFDETAGQEPNDGDGCMDL